MPISGRLLIGLIKDQRNEDMVTVVSKGPSVEVTLSISVSLIAIDLLTRQAVRAVATALSPSEDCLTNCLAGLRHTFLRYPAPALSPTLN